MKMIATIARMLAVAQAVDLEAQATLEAGLQAQA